MAKTINISLKAKLLCVTSVSAHSFTFGAFHMKTLHQFPFFFTTLLLLVFHLFLCVFQVFWTELGFVTCMFLPAVCVGPASRDKLSPVLCPVDGVKPAGVINSELGPRGGEEVDPTLRSSSYSMMLNSSNRTVYNNVWILFEV